MPLPGNVTTRTIIGTVVDFTGTPVAGSITFTLTPMLTNASANAFIVPSSMTATLDGNGAFSVTLPATNDPDLSPSGITYRVQENFTGGRTYTISLPESASDPIGLTDVMSAPTLTRTSFSPSYAQPWAGLTTRLTAAETTAAGTSGSAINATVTTNVATVTTQTNTVYATISPIANFFTIALLIQGATNLTTL